METKPKTKKRTAYVFFQELQPQNCLSTISEQKTPNLMALQANLFCTMQNNVIAKPTLDLTIEKHIV